MLPPQWNNTVLCQFARNTIYLLWNKFLSLWTKEKGLRKTNNGVSIMHCVYKLRTQEYLFFTWRKICGKQWLKHWPQMTDSDKCELGHADNRMTQQNVSLALLFPECTKGQIIHHIIFNGPKPFCLVEHITDLSQLNNGIGFRWWTDRRSKSRAL